ncbi:MAG: porin family protein [Cryobacterium sp.]|nr:porin family protein [Oligoflexia bacterium]
MFKGNSYARIIAASLLATTATSSVVLSLIASAKAEMVYDDEKTMSEAPAPTPVEVRNIIRNTNTNANTNVVPVAVTASVIAESDGMQKPSVKAREKRGFQESVNNELVVQKLEDKRLKQEEKLTSEINKKFTLEDDAPAGTSAPVVHEEVVVRPISDGSRSSYEMSAAPRVETRANGAIVQDQVSTYQSSTSLTVAPVGNGTSVTPVGKYEGEKSTRSGISITPRVGLSTISNDFYDLSNQGSAGVGLGFDVSENVGIELGYTYSTYQVGLKNQGGYGGFQPNQLAFKNNSVDMSMKLYLSGLDAKVRPFLGGGVAYSTGYINYNQSQNFYSSYQTGDYQLSQFSALVQAGLEFKISNNVSLGVSYKFIKPMSSTESQDGLYNNAFYGSYYGNNAYFDPNKQALRGTLRESNTQMVLVGASVTF